MYARKSNDDSDCDPHNKSVARQAAQGRTFAEERGWAVVEEFCDDGD
ncbi:MAG: recombinase family protein [Gammaproteobacteria bacterium]